MTKIDHLWDGSGILAKKVAHAAALVMLTYYPVVEDDYSPAHMVCSSLVDRRAHRSSIHNVEMEHINIFLSVSWMRNYLKRRFHVSFQRTVKLEDRPNNLSLNPYSIKFELATCHRQSFTCEEQMTSSIRSLSDELLSEYKNNHYESKTLDIKDDRVSTTVTKYTNMSPCLSSEVIAPIVTPDIPQIKLFTKGGRKFLTTCKMKILIRNLRLTIKRNNQKNLELQNQKYLKEANNEQCSESEKNCDLVSDLLLEACSRAGVLKKTINNQRQLSIDAGVIIRSMHSDCNVSFSKMPLTIHLCLTLLFGSINEKTAGILVQSSTTYSEAAAISSECVTVQTKLLFTDRSSEKRIVAAHISMDESEKKREALVVKLIQY